MEVWAWRKIADIQDERRRTEMVRMLEAILAGEIDEERWGESAAAVEAQEQLGASTPTMGFIE